MNKEQLKIVLENYKLKLQEINRDHMLDHALVMCDFNFDDIEKSMRWLGFIQGVLYTRSIYTIDELKEHNTTQTKFRIKSLE